MERKKIGGELLDRSVPKTVTRLFSCNSTRVLSGGPGSCEGKKHKSCVKKIKKIRIFITEDVRLHNRSIYSSARTAGAGWLYGSARPRPIK